jgi:DNA-binding response OmpR family regulator
MMLERTPPAILCVDDDEPNRRAFALLLRRAGFQTMEAPSGHDALRLAGQRPDLIILDVDLPDIDGLEVCRRIKAHPATAAIPVLHMSGVFVSTEDKAHALDDGADGYLTKPVEPRELLATVRALLRLHEAGTGPGGGAAVAGDLRRDPRRPGPDRRGREGGPLQPGLRGAAGPAGRGGAREGPRGVAAGVVRPGERGAGSPGQRAGAAA